MLYRTIDRIAIASAFTQFDALDRPSSSDVAHRTTGVDTILPFNIFNF